MRKKIPPKPYKRCCVYLPLNWWCCCGCVTEGHKFLHLFDCWRRTSYSTSDNIKAYMPTWLRWWRLRFFACLCLLLFGPLHTFYFCIRPFHLLPRSQHNNNINKNNICKLQSQQHKTPLRVKAIVLRTAYPMFKCKTTLVINFFLRIESICNFFYYFSFCNQVLITT